MAKSEEQILKEREKRKIKHLLNLEKDHAYAKEYHLKHSFAIKQRKKEHYQKIKNNKTHMSKDIDPLVRLRARRYALKHKYDKSQICQICKSPDKLQVHHLSYEKPYKNKWNVLCSTCHKIQHVKNFETSKYGRMSI